MGQDYNADVELYDSVKAPENPHSEHLMKRYIVFLSCTEKVIILADNVAFKGAINGIAFVDEQGEVTALFDLDKIYGYAVER